MYEGFQFFGMRLEMVADDHYVRSGGISRIHGFGGTYSSSYDKRERGLGTDGFDDLRRNGCLCSGTGFEIDGFFTHQFGGNGGIYDCPNAFGGGRIERFGARDTHRGSLHSAVYQDVPCRNHFHGGVLYLPCGLNLLTYKVFGIVSGKQREIQNGVRFGCELRCGAGEEDDGRTPVMTGFACKTAML